MSEKMWPLEYVLEYVPICNFCLFSGDSGEEQDEEEFTVGDIVKTKYLRSKVLAMITGFTMNGQFIVMYMDGKTARKSGSDFQVEYPISLLELMEAPEIDEKRKETYNKIMKDEERDVEDTHYLVSEYSTLTVEYNKR